jgi:hypothetical protein
MPTPTPPRLLSQTRHWCDWGASPPPGCRAVRLRRCNASRVVNHHIWACGLQDSQKSGDDRSRVWLSTREWDQPAIAIAGPQSFLAPRRRGPSPRNGPLVATCRVRHSTQRLPKCSQIQYTQHCVLETQTCASWPSVHVCGWGRRFPTKAGDPVSWWAVAGSNRGPPACKAGALTN